MRYELSFGPDSLHIVMEEDFTFHDSKVFRRMMSVLSNRNCRYQVYLNMRAVNYIDATALHLLMDAFDFAKLNHRVLIFDEPQGQVLEALNEAAQYNPIRIRA